MKPQADDGRHFGLWGATGIGVGAIVGGGILALTGVAFASTGPSAVLAFLINAGLAVLTAASFAEVATRFPESGGPYVYAKKLLSVEAAFMVGWVVWFASIAAGALYAIGFASFAAIALKPILARAIGLEISGQSDRILALALAIAATLTYMASLMRSARGGGSWANIGKVVVFAVLIGGGIVAALRNGLFNYAGHLTPFAPSGMHGLLQAMGYTFIAMQGFDLIAAVAGEVEAPQKNIPKAMFLSLGIALLIYIPLLLIVATVGVPQGSSLARLAAESPDAMVAIAARQYLGSAGYWLVVLAGVFSMLTALHANVLASSRMANAMAVDHSLPHRFSRLHPQRNTPIAALLLTSAVVIGVLLIVPNVEAAGAAASLIFLVSFALVHWLCILLRQRARPAPGSFRTPLYPLVPAVGGIGCIALAIFQGIAVPSAGIVASVWLGAGVCMFLVLFARSARISDDANCAVDPQIVNLRGRNPLVLVPVANPSNVGGLVTLAHALTPPLAGRVLLLNVVSANGPSSESKEESAFRDVQHVLNRALDVSDERGGYPEALITVSNNPWSEMDRVARAQRCESLLLGLGKLDEDAKDSRLNTLLGSVDSNVIILRAQEGWSPDAALRILVPLGGRGGHERLLARLLGSLRRTASREVTFLRVMSVQAGDTEVRASERVLRTTAYHLGEPGANVVVTRNADPLGTVLRHASEHDLIILGTERVGRHQKVFGKFAAAIASRTTLPMLIISSRQ